MHVRSAVVLALSLCLGACQTQTQATGVPAGRPNALVNGEIERQIAELRFLHGQALLDSMMQLSRMGEPAMAHIREGAQSPDWLTRASLAWVMGASGDRRYIEDLRRLGDDANDGVRYEAASALVELGDDAGFAMLVKGLGDDDIKVRFKCFEALHRATGQDFGYQHDGAPELRRVAVARWVDWLGSVKSSAL